MTRAGRGGGLWLARAMAYPCPLAALCAAWLLLPAAAPAPVIAGPGAAAPASSLAAPGAPVVGWRMALPGYRYRFPRDLASHPEFQTEWWYYTGHLEGGGRRFGYQLTFFRVGLDPARAASRSAWAPHSVYFAHAALTDESGRRYHADSRVMRPALGLAGADTARYRVWVDDWSGGLDADGITHRLEAAAGDFALDLALTPDKPPVIQGEDGVSRKSAGLGRASHYVSFTRMTTSGRVALGRDTLSVTGSSWMDHEFGSNQLGPGQAGWDWFSVQLDDGRELMLYRLRLANGHDEPMSSGTLVERDGRSRHLRLADFHITGDGAWKSPRSGAVYPARWRLEVPGAGIDLSLEPTVSDQEMDSPPPIAVSYWEGSVTARGTSGGRAVRGRGYVELTGYAGNVPGF